MMQKTSLKNIAGFIIKNPQRIPVLINKVFQRITDPDNAKTDNNWIHTHRENFDEWAMQRNKEVWSEAEAFSAHLKISAEEKLKQFSFSMGGGGIYPILYFLTRLYQPEVIVETGVAAGYSSQTFLSAIHKNGKGMLYSSDFPYFRLKNPEKYIGVLVDEHLKNNWKLFIEGDRKNLPVICNEAERIDMFHYDSDKTHAGRDFAFETIKSKLHPNSIILFDDVQDNNHFKNFVSAHSCKFHLFSFHGKYAGLVYDLKI